MFQKPGSALLSLALLAALVAPLTAQAQGPRLVRQSPAIFPPHAGDPQGQELALALADRAGAELFSGGNYTHFHVKQVMSMARRHGLTSADFADLTKAKEAAAILGASGGVTGALTKDTKGAWLLSLQAFDARGKSKAKKVALGSDLAAVVGDGGSQMAALYAGLVGTPAKPAAIHPDTKSSEAMAAYVSCFATITRQPMGLRASHVIDAEHLTAARKSCRQAVTLDPKFHAAWAALSLASSLSFENEEAAKALKKAQEATGYLPLAVLAHYWLATRFTGNQRGAEILGAAMKKYPGALIFLTYLGEHLNVTKKYGDAKNVWGSYIRAVPKSSYGLSQQGYALARLGQLEPAIAKTREAVKLNDNDLQAQLELASRLVDAKKFADARAILEPLMKHKRVDGEMVLRLGFIYLMQGELAPAEEHFNRALAMAKGPEQWRTRGRARYDLALVMGRKGKLAAAEEQLLAAAAEGFLVRDVLKYSTELKPLAERPKVAHLFKDDPIAVPSKVLFATPFPMNSAGEAIPAARRPPAVLGITF